MYARLVTILIKAGWKENESTMNNSSPLTRLLQVNDSKNIELLLAAGYPITLQDIYGKKGWLEKYPRNTPLIHFLVELVQTVLPLQCLCRQVIRKRLGSSHLIDKIDSLNVPHRMNNYLKLDGLGHEHK